jgi:hypothetical protein
MKPALFYSLAAHGRTQIVAVTSIKRERNWYGRAVRDNMATHGTLSGLLGRFETEEAASAARDEIKAIRDRYEPIIDVAQQSLSALYRQRDDEIAARYGKPRP